MARRCRQVRIHRARLQLRSELEGQEENVTRDVIADLWPLYVSGEASQDTRGLIEAFLSEHSEFARRLSQNAREPLPEHGVPSLTPDHELKTLALIKRPAPTSARSVPAR